MSRLPRSRKRWLRTTLVVLAAVAVLCAAIALYAGSYSHADRTALAALSDADATDEWYAYGSADADTALILYPGGKVEYTAYAPLAKQVSDAASMLVIVPKMPLNLAVLDPTAASRVMEAYPQVARWYVGGHSLGGAMAASFAAGAPESVSGVVLLAAYSTKPLTMPVLSVYGTLDTVMDSQKYAKYRENLPEELAEAVLSGGNHAQFGSYGVQAGDTTAAIPAQRQWELTAAAIQDWIGSQK